MTHLLISLFLAGVPLVPSYGPINPGGGGGGGGVGPQGPIGPTGPTGPGGGVDSDGGYCAAALDTSKLSLDGTCGDGPVDLTQTPASFVGDPNASLAVTTLGLGGVYITASDGGKPAFQNMYMGAMDGQDMQAIGVNGYGIASGCENGGCDWGNVEWLYSNSAALGGENAQLFNTPGDAGGSFLFGSGADPGSGNNFAVQIQIEGPAAAYTEPGAIGTVGCFLYSYDNNINNPPSAVSDCGNTYPDNNVEDLVISNQEDAGIRLQADHVVNPVGVIGASGGIYGGPQSGIVGTPCTPDEAPLIVYDPAVPCQAVCLGGPNWTCLGAGGGGGAGDAGILFSYTGQVGSDAGSSGVGWITPGAISVSQIFGYVTSPGSNPSTYSIVVTDGTSVCTSLNLSCSVSGPFQSVMTGACSWPVNSSLYVGTPGSDSCGAHAGVDLTSLNVWGAGAGGGGSGGGGGGCPDGGNCLVNSITATNPSGPGLIVPQGTQACFDTSCNAEIFTDGTDDLTIQSGAGYMQFDTAGGDFHFNSGNVVLSQSLVLANSGQSITMPQTDPVNLDNSSNCSLLEDPTQDSVLGGVNCHNVDFNAGAGFAIYNSPGSVDGPATGPLVGDPCTIVGLKTWDLANNCEAVCPSSLVWTCNNAPTGACFQQATCEEDGGGFCVATFPHAFDATPSICIVMSLDGGSSEVTAVGLSATQAVATDISTGQAVIVQCWPADAGGECGGTLGPQGPIGPTGPGGVSGGTNCDDAGNCYGNNFFAGSDGGSGNGNYYGETVCLGADNLGCMGGALVRAGPGASLQIGGGSTSQISIDPGTGSILQINGNTQIEGELQIDGGTEEWCADAGDITIYPGVMTDRVDFFPDSGVQCGPPVASIDWASGALQFNSSSNSTFNSPVFFNNYIDTQNIDLNGSGNLISFNNGGGPSIGGPDTSQNTFSANVNVSGNVDAGGFIFAGGGAFIGGNLEMTASSPAGHLYLTPDQLDFLWVDGLGNLQIDQDNSAATAGNVIFHCTTAACVIQSDQDFKALTNITSVTGNITATSGNIVRGTQPVLTDGDDTGIQPVYHRGACTASGTTCTATFAHAFPNAPTGCFCNDLTAAQPCYIDMSSGVSSVSVNIFGATNGDSVQATCLGY